MCVCDVCDREREKCVFVCRLSVCVCKRMCMCVVYVCVRACVRVYIHMCE
jgi:hypothetical protein